MTSFSGPIEEIAFLTRVVAGYAREEGEINLARNLEAIASGADAALVRNAELHAVIDELREAYLALLAPKESGLSNFFRWDPDFSTRTRLNADLDEARHRLEALLLASTD